MWPLNIEKIYKEQPELNKDVVNNLMEWCKKQSHFPTNITETHVIIFLHCCYYSAEAAKTAMENFYTVRGLCPEFFANRDPTSEAIKQHLNVVFCTNLKQKSPEGYNLVMVKFLDSDPENFNLTEQIRIFDMFTYMWWNAEGLMNGVYLILDMNGCVFGHIKKIQLMAVKKYLYYVQEAMPVRLKGIHVINALPFVDIILSMIKPFMHKKFFELIHIHTQMDTFSKFIPIECLPKDCGGNDPPIAEQDAEQKASFLACKDFFLSHENLKADETKRTGKPKNEGDLFGVEGTFKKLDID